MKWLRRWQDMILHWDMAVVGGFLGMFSITLFEGNFGNAQTANILGMADAVAHGDGSQLLLRLGSFALFGAGVAVSYLLTNFTNWNMRKLVLYTDAAALLLVMFLPSSLPAEAGIYPLFFATALQWGSYSGAGGYNSASIFCSNNFKQSVLSWTQFVVTGDRSFIRRGILYSFTVLSFFAGGIAAALLIGAVGRAAGWACLVPLVVARVLIALGGLPAVPGTPEERAMEAEEDLAEQEELERRFLRRKDSMTQAFEARKADLEESFTKELRALEDAYQKEKNALGQSER